MRRHCISNLMPTAIIACLAVFILLPAAGCGKKPKLAMTHPVYGTVVFQGGKPVAGGTVVFQSEADADVSASGVIGADGKFTLSSFIASDRQPGALPGKHRVMVIPPLDPAGPGGLWQGKLVEQSFIVKPGDNEVTLTIQKS